MKNKERILTPEQEKFLEALFGEAKGDFNKAKALAGYSESTKSRDIIKSLRDEIIEMSKDVLALNGPKASMKLIGLLDDPTAAGANNTIKVAESVLNRIGVSQTKEDVNLKVPSGGLFIMPMKDSEAKKLKEESEDEGNEV